MVKERIKRLVSFFLDSKSLARPVAWVMEVGWSTTNSRLISRIRSKMKQLKIIFGVRHKT